MIVHSHSKQSKIIFNRVAGVKFAQMIGKFLGCLPVDRLAFKQIIAAGDPAYMYIYGAYQLVRNEGFSYLFSR